MAVSSPTERAEFVSATDAATYNLCATTGAFTPTANSLLVAVVVGVKTADAVFDITSLTSTGMALTWTVRRFTGWTNTQFYRMHVFTAEVGASPASVTAVNALWNQTILGCDGWIGEVSGHDPANPLINDLDQNNSNATDHPSVTLPLVPNVNSLTMIAAFTRRNPPNWTVPAGGWVEHMDTGISTPVSGLWVASKTPAVQTLSGVTGADALAKTLGWEIPPAPTAINLTVANAAHAHTSDSVPTMTGGSTLVVADSFLGHAGESFALVQQHTLVVADGAHAHTADNVVVMPVVVAIDLVVANAAHLHRIGALDGQPPGLNDVVPITVQHILVAQDATHAHVADSAAITKQSIVVVADAAHAHAADNAAITKQSALAVDAAAHAHIAENAVITISSSLVVADAAHAHTADGLVLIQQHVLVVAGAAHALASDSPTLTQQHVLVVAAAVHAHVADQLATMVQNTALALADALHIHISGAPTLIYNSTLTVDNAAHLHSGQNVALSSGGSLGVADATHGHVATSPTLAQTHVLSVDAAVHAHSASAPVLLTTTDLAIAAAVHAVTSAQVTVSTPVQLVVASATHALTSADLVLVQAHVLAVDGAWHGHVAQVVVLAYGRPWQLDYVRSRPGMVDVSPIGSEQPTSQGVMVSTTPSAGDGLRSTTPATMRREPEGTS